MTFLQKGNRDGLFGGKRVNVVAVAGDGHDLDAQGRKRTNMDAEEYMDTVVLHGGRQRAKVATVYPQLLERSARQGGSRAAEAELSWGLLTEGCVSVMGGCVAGRRSWRRSCSRRRASCRCSSSTSSSWPPCTCRGQTTTTAPPPHSTTARPLQQSAPRSVSLTLKSSHSLPALRLSLTPPNAKSCLSPSLPDCLSQDLAWCPCPS